MGGKSAIPDQLGQSRSQHACFINYSERRCVNYFEHSQDCFVVIVDTVKAPESGRPNSRPAAGDNDQTELRRGFALGVNIPPMARLCTTLAHI
jgi:hypothetical protein